MNENLYKHIGDILQKSILDGLKEFLSSFKKIKTYLFGSIGAFYSTREKLFNELNNAFTEFLSGYPLVKAIFFTLLALLVLFIYYQIKQFFIHSWRRWILIKRESVYGNAIVLLSKGYAKIHKNRNKEIPLDEVKELLVDFCDKIRDIYEFKTKAKCSVSIKTIIDLQEGQNGISFDTRVVNLCRDSMCKKRYDGDYDKIEHKIANNSCYQKIIGKFFSDRHEEMYFLSNDLASLSDYENSSFLLFPEYDIKVRESEPSRREKWPLKYKSELVVSITPLEKETKTQYPIIGFLCIDCELENGNVFNSYYDLPLIQGVADGLYDFIKFNLYKPQQA